MSDNIWALNYILGSECDMYLAGAIRRASGVSVPYAVIGSTVYHPSLFHFYYVITCTSISIRYLCFEDIIQEKREFRSLPN